MAVVEAVCMACGVFTASLVLLFYGANSREYRAFLFAAFSLALAGAALVGSRAAEVLYVFCAVYCLWRWFRSGGGRGGCPRFKRWVRKFKPVRRTAPIPSAA